MTPRAPASADGGPPAPPHPPAPAARQHPGSQQCSEAEAVSQDQHLLQLSDSCPDSSSMMQYDARGGGSGAWGGQQQRRRQQQQQQWAATGVAGGE